MFIVVSSSDDSLAGASTSTHTYADPMMTEESHNSSSSSPHPVSPQPHQNHPSVNQIQDRDSSSSSSSSPHWYGIASANEEHAMELPLTVTKTKKRRRYNIQSNKRSTDTTTGRWNSQEHAIFVQGLTRHGRDWKKIASLLESRTPMQVRSHAQKFFAKQQQQQEESRTSGLDDDELMMMMTPTAARILAEPETVEREVRETLHALHERYRQLQQRLLQQQQEVTPSSAVPGAMSIRNNPAIISREQSPDEWIAMHVLRDFSRQSSLEQEDALAAASDSSCVTASTFGQNE